MPATVEVCPRPVETSMSFLLPSPALLDSSSTNHQQPQHHRQGMQNNYHHSNHYRQKMMHLSRQAQQPSSSIINRQDDNSLVNRQQQTLLRRSLNCSSVSSTTTVPPTTTTTISTNYHHLNQFGGGNHNNKPHHHHHNNNNCYQQTNNNHQSKSSSFCSTNHIVNNSIRSDLHYHHHSNNSVRHLKQQQAIHQASGGCITSSNYQRKTNFPKKSSNFRTTNRLEPEPEEQLQVQKYFVTNLIPSIMSDHSGAELTIVDVNGNKNIMDKNKSIINLDDIDNGNEQLQAQNGDEHNGNDAFDSNYLLNSKSTSNHAATEISPSLETLLENAETSNLSSGSVASSESSTSSAILLNKTSHHNYNNGNNFDDRSNNNCATTVTNGFDKNSLYSKSMNGDYCPKQSEIVKLSKHILDWTVSDVAVWLESNQFSNYIDLFCKQHLIDGSVLVNLTIEDLRNEPLGLTVFGDIKRLCMAFRQLRDYYLAPHPSDDQPQHKSHHQHHHLLPSSSFPLESMNLPELKNSLLEQSKQPEQNNNNNYNVSQDNNNKQNKISKYLIPSKHQIHHNHQHSQLPQNAAICCALNNSNSNGSSSSSGSTQNHNLHRHHHQVISAIDSQPQQPTIMNRNSENLKKNIIIRQRAKQQRQQMIDQNKHGETRNARRHLVASQMMSYIPSKSNSRQLSQKLSAYQQQQLKQQQSNNRFNDNNYSSDDEFDDREPELIYEDDDYGETDLDDEEFVNGVEREVKRDGDQVGIDAQIDEQYIVKYPRKMNSSNRHRANRQDNIIELDHSHDFASISPGSISPSSLSSTSSSSSSSSTSTFDRSNSYNDNYEHVPETLDQAPYSFYLPDSQIKGRIIPTRGNFTQQQQVSTTVGGYGQPVNANTHSGTRISHHANNKAFSRKAHSHHHNHRELKPEIWKAILAMAYFFASTWVTAIIMVIVHDRVPSMDTYPPLPDILLDNLPRIPWAFGMCEFCGLVLFIIWALILIFHKHRFILLRRMFSLFGSVFLLRCVTMLITSLSVPGRHLDCKARPYGNWLERIQQAYLIWQGGGMSIQGVRTCGDYMFSGHTVVLTLLNFFITEYTPPKLYLIHTTSWVLNLFGIFFILAAHEHYSIDVFVAFYISTRLFLYYHTLANNRALYQHDRRRTRIWFPLFYFFESGVSGMVPNHYEIPFRHFGERCAVLSSRQLLVLKDLLIVYCIKCPTQTLNSLLWPADPPPVLSHRKQTTGHSSTADSIDIISSSTPLPLPTSSATISSTNDSASPSGKIKTQ